VHRGRGRGRDALKELERRRIEMIVSLAEQGKEPPIPRSRSPHLTRFGLHMIWDCRAASPHFWQAR